MRYWLGIDGGGTKTRLKILDESDRVIGEKYGGGSNLNSLSEKKVFEHLKALIENGISENGLSLSDCAGICLGSAGAGREIVRGKLRQMLCSVCPDTPVFVLNDLLPLLFAEFHGGAGVLLVAGTGSVCLAQNKTGEICQAGGWGNILGDEGSGYAVGLAALKAVAREYDGRSGKTLLTPLVCQALGISDAKGICDFVYESGADRAKIAAFAPLCEKAYASGDEAAIRIFKDAAEALFEIYDAACGRAGLTESEKSRCVLVGGLGERSSALRAELENIARIRGGRVKFVSAAQDAAYACCLIAKNRFAAEE